MSGLAARKRGLSMTVVEQGLPFVVEPISVQRVQLWGSFASQWLTRSAFSVVCEAFYAFWYEAGLQHSYRQTLQWVQEGRYDFAVRWLDLVVDDLLTVEQYWREVLRLIASDGELRERVEQWTQEATQHIASVGMLRAQAVGLVVQWSEQYQWPLPEHTQAFLAGVQTRA